MDIDLTLKNYRCFPDTMPARFRVRSGITAFVGVNNVGKSSLLRLFYEFRGLFGLIGTQGGGLTQSLVASPGVGMGPEGVLDPTEVYSNSNDRPLVIEVRVMDGLPSPTGGVPEAESVTVTGLRNGSFTTTIAAPDGTRLGAGGAAPVQWASLSTLQAQGGRIVSIAQLLEAVRPLSETLYVGAFRNALNLGSMGPYYDINTGQAFIETWRQYKTGPGKSGNIAANRITEDIRRIFGFESLEINASADSTTLQVFVNGRPYMLHEVGSGLTQFIIVLVNVAMRRPAFVLIDEPELNLHPSLQMDFLTTLASYATEGLLCATHSLGLARAGADWIYTVRGHGDGESEVWPFEALARPSEFLGELGFASYRDLGCDQVLLVEGRTEIKTVQQLLRRYDKDHRIVALTLGGDTLITADAEAALEEVKRLTPHVAALIDSERDRPDGPLRPARAAFVETCRRLEVPCHVLRLRAIENYFPDEAVKQVKGEKYRALGPYEDPRAVTPMWGREENWRIARELGREYLDSTDLGPFLSSL